MNGMFRGYAGALDFRRIFCPILLIVLEFNMRYIVCKSLMCYTIHLYLSNAATFWANAVICFVNSFFS